MGIQRVRRPARHQGMPEVRGREVPLLHESPGGDVGLQTLRREGESRNPSEGPRRPRPEGVPAPCHPSAKDRPSSGADGSGEVPRRVPCLTRGTGVHYRAGIHPRNVQGVPDRFQGSFKLGADGGIPHLSGREVRRHQVAHPSSGEENLPAGAGRRGVSALQR
jgi:hypothetical protein